jgi:rhodanese-related sulfurtransferase
VAAESIDITTAYEMWCLGDPVIDVRTPEEYSLGHIAGALHVPLDALSARRAELPPGPIITACSYGRRASRAADLLTVAGRSAFSLRGGTKAWQAAGLPIVTGPEPGKRGQRRRSWRRRRGMRLEGESG